MLHSSDRRGKRWDISRRPFDAVNEAPGAAHLSLVPRAETLTFRLPPSSPRPHQSHRPASPASVSRYRGYSVTPAAPSFTDVHPCNNVYENRKATVTSPFLRRAPVRKGRSCI